MGWLELVRGRADEEHAVVAEGEMVGGDGGLERGEDEDLAGVVRAVGADLEDGAGAVADEEIAVAVEGDAGGDAHAFGEGGDVVAFGRDAVDGAFGARAGVEIAVRAEGERGDVEEVAREGARLEVAADADDGDGRALAARAADHGEEVAVGVDGGVGDEVELVGHGDGDVGVEHVGDGAVGAEGEIAGDGAFGDADERAIGAHEVEVGGGVAEAGGAGSWAKLRAVVGDGQQVRAEDFEAAAGDGGAWREAIEVRSLSGGGAGWGAAGSWVNSVDGCGAREANAENGCDIQ